MQHLTQEAFCRGKKLSQRGVSSAAQQPKQSAPLCTVPAAARPGMAAGEQQWPWGTMGIVPGHTTLWEEAAPGGGRWHQQRAPNQWQVWGARKEVPTGMAKGWCRGMLEVWPDPWCCFLCFCREPPPCCSDGVYGVLGGKEGQGWCDQCSPCCQCGYLQAPTADVHGGGLAVFMTCPHQKAGDRQETLPCFMPTG